MRFADCRAAATRPSTIKQTSFRVKNDFYVIDRLVERAEPRVGQPDLHRTKIPADDPRLSIDRPRSRTLRKGPAVLGPGVVAVLGAIALFVAFGHREPNGGFYRGALANP